MPDCNQLEFIDSIFETNKEKNAPNFFETLSF